MLACCSRFAAAIFLILVSADLAVADDAAIIRGLFGIDPGVLVGPRARPRQDWVLEGPVGGRRTIDRRPSQRQSRETVAAPSTSPSEETIVLRKEIQRRLKLLGYFQDEPNGIFGPKSRTAIKRFQRRINETADGKLSERQVARLYEITGDAVADGDDGFGAFPTLAPADAAGVAGNGDGQDFPALAARDAAPGAGGAFPTLGRGPSGDAPGMPPLSKSQDGMEDEGMPGLATAPSAAGRGGTSFPALAAQPAAGAAANSLPPLAREREVATDDLPALATTETPAPAAFPSLTPAKEKSDLAAVELKTAATPAPDYPGLVAPPPPRDPKEELRERGDFAVELGRVPDFEAGAMPKILDIALNLPLSDIDGKLKPSGFPTCSVANGSASCVKSTPSLDDRIEAQGLGNGAIWSLRRRIEFKQPVKRDYILSRLTDSMPSLMKKGDFFLASRPTCTKTFVRTLDATNRLDEAKAALDRAERVEGDGTLAFAIRCPLFFDVLVTPGQGDVASIDIWFFDGTPLVRREAARLEEQSTRENEKLKVVDTDLKL